jgi:hypothetical protein
MYDLRIEKLKAVKAEIEGLKTNLDAMRLVIEELLKELTKETKDA